MPIVAPTTQNRIAVLDTLRGVAILGILLANIAYFAGPALSQLASREGPSGGWVSTATLAFVNGKFRTMLAILFGVGIWMQYEKRRHAYPLWPGGYLKRAFWLSVIGLLHGCFIWSGDILFMYSNVAVLIALIAAWPEKKLRTLLGLAVAASLVIAVGLAALIRLMGEFEVSEPPPSAVPAANPSVVAPRGQSEAGNPTEFRSAFAQAMAALKDPEIETRIFAQGTYAEQTLARSIAFVASVTQMLFLLPELGGLFLLGLLLARHGVLIAPSRHPRARNWLLFIGWGIGFPLNLLGLTAGAHGPTLEQLMLWEGFIGPLLGIGYLIAIAICVEHGLFSGLWHALAKVGRVALSTYLMQSLLCTAFFYSWGLGYFGKLSAEQSLVVVLVVWAINIVAAHLWLRAFALGPVEWLWRCLTEGRRFPILRSRQPSRPLEPPSFEPRFEL